MFDRWITLCLAFLPSIRAALAILLIGGGLAALARRLATRGLGRLTPEARRFAGRAVYVAVWVGAALLALAVLGVHVAALATLLGALGLAVTLALQDVARNFVAGIYLLVEHPFGPGDRITLRGETGQIVFVGLRTTLLRRDDGAEVIVPNTVILSEVVVRPAGGRI
jgi:small-conductance mechanosensitive channel